MSTIFSLNISQTKGVNKKPVEQVELQVNHGVVGDAHAGDWHRQVSLLAEESIACLRKRGSELAPCAFAENITTKGLDLATLPIGTRLGNEQVGDCIIPREGIFAKWITPDILPRGARLDLLP